jgi:hypothetical protein
MSTTIRAHTTNGPSANVMHVGPILLVAFSKCHRAIATSALFAALLLALSATAQAAGPASADNETRLGDTFSILLQGPYRPVVHAPRLGLSQVNVGDGSFSTTKIFAISGLPKQDRERASRSSRDGDGENAIGNFFVQFGGRFAAYDLPGGALTMTFTGSNVQNVPDGEGGTYIVGTFELDIVEATGDFGSFAGGHNHMVDILHRLADGTFVEHCICIIRRGA